MTYEPLTGMAAFQLRQAATEALAEVLRKAAVLRAGRSVDEWVAGERDAMWTGARDFAQQHGLKVPLLADVERAERLATGHSDFARKWPLYVAEILVPA